jgi:glycosyltransferase involved in cell wall biosynthesis
MTERPRLALLIPAFNAAATLPRLFESAARQDEPFDETWVYDDCSTDDTIAVAERHGARIVRGDVNRGCTYAKSVLTERATSDWIHFHDADDLLLPNFIAASRKWLAIDDADAVVFGCEERWEETGDLVGVSVPDDSSLAADPIDYTIRVKVNAISGIYRRAAFLAAGAFDLDPLVHFNEDQACHCQLARAGFRFRADPTVTVTNLRRQSSMWTANQAKCLRAHYFVMRKALAGNGGTRCRTAIAERLWHVAAGSASFLDWQTADEAATEAMGLAGPSVAPSGPLFRNLCRVSPRFALRAREWSIRSLRPRLRENHPGWRAPVNLL